MEDIAQTLGYLKASGIEHGLLTNFGSYKFQIKKYILSDMLPPAIYQSLATILFSFASFAVLFRG